MRDFPGGPVIKNPSSNARVTGSIPGWRTKITHAVGQLSSQHLKTIFFFFSDLQSVLEAHTYQGF